MKRLITLYICISCINQLVAQVPAITDFNPKSGEVGSTVAITGTNFSTTPANNVVFFGGVRATVTAATATQLTVLAPLGTTFNLITVTVNALTAYSRTPFLLTFPSNFILDPAVFSLKFNVNTGASPYFISSFDIDGDGKPDIVTRNTNNTVSLFRNTSVINTVSFAPKIDITVPTGTNYKILFADIDGDAKPDIVGSNFIIRNTAFSGSIPVNMPATSLVSFGTGTDFDVNDMNLDGKPDYVFLLSTSSSGSCTSGKIAKTLRNRSTTGNISFTTSTVFPDNYCLDGFSVYTEIDNVNNLAISDFDNNGFPDYATIKVLGGPPEGSVNLNFYDTAPGAGGDPRLNGASYVKFRLFSVDVDGDDRTDVITVGRPVVGTSNYGFMSVYKNGSIYKRTAFMDAVSFNILGYNSTSNFCFANLDGNDKPDFISFEESTTASLLAVSLNKSQPGIIAFSTMVTFELQNIPKGVAVADIDSDGKPDIIIANGEKNNFTVLLNQIKYIEAANFIEGISNVCSNQKNISYSVPVIKGADSYEWTVPAGVTIKSGVATRSIVVDIENNAPLQGEIKVRGLSGNVKGGFSPTFIYNTLSTPIAPANLKTQAGSSSSTGLVWEDKSVNESEFFIYRAKGKDSVFVLLDKRNKDITSYTDNFDIQPNTTYYYRVAAANGECLSAFSNIVGITTPPPVITALADFSEKSITISPNPSEGIFEIAFEKALTGKVQFVVRDALGKIIYQETTKNLSDLGKYMLDLRKTGAGVYFLTIQTEKSKLIRKIIRQ